MTKAWIFTKARAMSAARMLTGHLGPNRAAVRSAPSLGQDNTFVYGDLLGMSGERLEQLTVDGTV